MSDINEALLGSDDEVDFSYDVDDQTEKALLEDEEGEEVLELNADDECETENEVDGDDERRCGKFVSERTQKEEENSLNMDKIKECFENTGFVKRKWQSRHKGKGRKPFYKMPKNVNDKRNKTVAMNPNFRRIVQVGQDDAKLVYPKRGLSPWISGCDPYQNPMVLQTQHFVPIMPNTNCFPQYRQSPAMAPQMSSGQPFPQRPELYSTPRSMSAPLNIRHSPPFNPHQPPPPFFAENGSSHMYGNNCVHFPQSNSLAVCSPPNYNREFGNGPDYPPLRTYQSDGMREKYCDYPRPQNNRTNNNPPIERFNKPKMPPNLGGQQFPDEFYSTTSTKSTPFNIQHPPPFNPHQPPPSFYGENGSSHMCANNFDPIPQRNSLPNYSELPPNYRSEFQNEPEYPPVRTYQSDGIRERFPVSERIQNDRTNGHQPNQRFIRSKTNNRVSNDVKKVQLPKRGMKTSDPPPKSTPLPKTIKVEDEDEETRLYRKKIEEQKRKREEVLRKKEENRRKQALLKDKDNEPFPTLPKKVEHTSNVTIKLAESLSAWEEEKSINNLTPLPSESFALKQSFLQDRTVFGDNSNIIVLKKGF